MRLCSKKDCDVCEQQSMPVMLTLLAIRCILWALLHQHVHKVRLSGSKNAGESDCFQLHSAVAGVPNAADQLGNPPRVMLEYSVQAFCILTCSIMLFVLQRSA